MGTRDGFRMKIVRRLAAACLAALPWSASRDASAADAPLVIAKSGYVFAGGKIDDRERARLAVRGEQAMPVVVHHDQVEAPGRRRNLDRRLGLQPLYRCRRRGAMDPDRAGAETRQGHQQSSHAHRFPF